MSERELITHANASVWGIGLLDANEKEFLPVC